MSTDIRIDLYVEGWSVYKQTKITQKIDTNNQTILHVTNTES